MNLLDPSTLFDSDAEAMAVLKRTLVLCPVYDRPTLPTGEMLNLLQDCGAHVHINRGVSDVALHRCIITHQALRIINADPDRFDTVFWLDGDMTAPTVSVAALCKLALEVDACVNGLASKKTDAKAWCLQRVDAPAESVFGVVLTPVVCGLACMAMPVTALQHLAESVPNFTLTEMAQVPALFQSRVVFVNGLPEWHSEDIDFCVTAWEKGVGVFSAPIPFGHLGTFAVLPDPEGDWMPGGVTIRASVDS
jgi:hypothetical protein